MAYKAQTRTMANDVTFISFLQPIMSKHLTEKKHEFDVHIFYNKVAIMSKNYPEYMKCVIYILINIKLV